MENEVVYRCLTPHARALLCRRRRSWHRTDCSVAIQVLVKTSLERFQCIARPGYDSPCPVGDHVAAAVGIPDRVLIEARQMQGNFISATGLFRSGKRPAAELAHRDR